MPTLTLIAALSRNRVIGRAGRLPWHLPADLARFKQHTLGRWLLVGHRTFQGLAQELGGPLPGRHHVILSRSPTLRIPGCLVAHDLEQALALLRAQGLGPTDEALVIGGAQVYAQTLPLAQRLLLTEVQAQVEGDALFPPLPPATFRLVRDELRPADANNPLPMRFQEHLRQAP